MANNFFVSYDLKVPGKNYPKVQEAIQSIKSWHKMQFSLYYLTTTLSLEEVATKVWAAMDVNDTLLVIDAKNARMGGFPQATMKVVQSNWNR